MSIVQFDRAVILVSLDASETGERTKCPWVGVVGLINSPTHGHFVLSPVSLALMALHLRYRTEK